MIGGSTLELKETSSYSERKPFSKYTRNYRILKTIVLLCSWISYGMNNEIVSSTFEDLRVHLSLNYDGITYLLVVRDFGSLGMMFFSGFIYDKFSNYSELIMSMGGLFLVLPNLFIPNLHSYWPRIVFFLIQGLGGALFEIGGCYITLKLWKGISTSPINVLYAGYGMGGLLIIQLSKPFIKFNTIDTVNVNMTSAIDQINIEMPYFITSAIGVSISLLLIIAQLAECRNEKLFTKNVCLQQDLTEKPSRLIHHQQQASEAKQKNNFFKKLLFGKNVYTGRTLVYLLVQLGLLITLFFVISGYMSLKNRFMLTYLTRGPAKLSVNEYTLLNTVHWMLFVASRLITAFLVFKLNTVLFLFVVFLLNATLCCSFVVPYLTQFNVFTWIGISLMGFISGPMQPSIYMLAKTCLSEYNSFIMSIFSISMSCGSMFFQKLSGNLLDAFAHKENMPFMGYDSFQPASLIVNVISLNSVICFGIYALIVFFYKKYGKHILKK